MYLVVDGTRLDLELTPDMALELITELSKAVKLCNKTNAAWFADGIVLEHQGQQVAGRLTIRVEKI